MAEPMIDIFSLAIGFGIGAGTVGVGVYVMVKRAKLSSAAVITAVMFAVLAAALAMPGAAFAQSNQIEIPTDVIFSETNTWISTFAPIAAIGIGITIALAVLGYIGKMIASAFR
jgi:hypothetical protein